MTCIKARHYELTCKKLQHQEPSAENMCILLYFNLMLTLQRHTQHCYSDTCESQNNVS